MGPAPRSCPLGQVIGQWPAHLGWDGRRSPAAANGAGSQGLDLDPAGGSSSQSRSPPALPADGGTGADQPRISGKPQAHDSPDPTGPGLVAAGVDRTGELGFADCMESPKKGEKDSSDLTSVRQVHAGSASCGCTMPLTS